MYNKYLKEIKNEIKKEKITLTNLAKDIGISEVCLKNLLNKKIYSIKLLEKIYKYIFKAEYLELNILSEFSSEELLLELLRREKNSK